MENTALQPSPISKPLTKEELLMQVRVIQDVMNSVMKKDEHYGTIPGCGPKPTLLKAGAEKLMHTFRFSPDYEITSLFPGDDDKIGYQIICKITSTHTGNFMGSGLGECSTEEEKFKWRKSVSEEEFAYFDDGEKARLKFTKDGTAQQVRTNPRDLANTVLKMAKKRALVDAVLTVCAASDIFAQDLEDMTESHNVNTRGAGMQATTKPDEWVTGTLTDFVPKNGKYPHKLVFEVGEGQSETVSNYSLPDGWDQQALAQCFKEGRVLQFQYILKGKFKNFTKLRLYSPETEDGPSPEAPISPEPEDSEEPLTLQS